MRGYVSLSELELCCSFPLTAKIGYVLCFVTANLLVWGEISVFVRVCVSRVGVLRNPIMEPSCCHAFPIHTVNPV